MVQRFSLIFAFAGLASQAQLGSGFMPISGKAVISNTIVFSSDYENQNNQNPSGDGPETQVETPAKIKQQPAANQPPRPADPLMASLTRMDPSTTKAPTRNIPIFGEVPADDRLILVAAVTVIAVLGFILSIVVTFNNQDEFVRIINQATKDLSDQNPTNKVYDESVCRGLCSSQKQDLEGLRGFMDSLRK